MPEMAAAVQRIWSADRLDRDLDVARSHGIRAIANTVTLLAWHNGPIENIHAERFGGYELEERRVFPQAEKAIIRQAQSDIFSGLNAVDYLRHDNAGPPFAERVLPFLHGLIGPRGWSYSEQSRPVEVPLRQDG